MEYTRYTAKTIDEAITKACLDLGVTSDRLDYHVTQEPTNGFLGIGSKPAIIKARKKAEEVKPEPVVEEVKAEPVVEAKEEPKETVSEQPTEEKKIVTSDEIEKRAALAAQKAKAAGTSAPEETRSRKPRRERGGREDRRRPNRRERSVEIEKKHEASKPKPERVITPKTEEEVAELTKTAEEFLRSVFAAMNVEVQMSIEYHQEEGSLNISFTGDEMGILIGKRGQTLDSLQYLTSLVINKGNAEYVRVKLDTEDYRTRRAETLHNLARNIAFKVRKTRRPVSLEPMNPYERRIIHSSLQNNKFVETYSEGEEPYRHVVVAPKR